MGCVRSLLCAGQLVWRRHVGLPIPSHHALRSTCMQLLPLVEMYCRWELEEDCTSLRNLLLRFDSELELETHDLGRSLLAMVRDADEEFQGLPRFDNPIPSTNPFEAVRERLQAAQLAIRELRVEVQLIPLFSSRFDFVLAGWGHHANPNTLCLALFYEITFNMEAVCLPNIQACICNVTIHSKPNLLSVQAPKKNLSQC